MLTRAMAKELSAASAHECLFVDFLFEEEPKKVSEALKHPGWVDAMQEELNQFARHYLKGTPILGLCKSIAMSLVEAEYESTEWMLCQVYFDEESANNDGVDGVGGCLHFLNVFYDPRIIWEQRIAALRVILGYDVYKLEDEVWKVYELALMSWLPHLAAVAEVSKKRGHVLSYLTMGWSKQVNKLLEGF
ncbi:hypothetical protein Tco_0807981 [Tanacetum coccineum]